MSDVGTLVTLDLPDDSPVLDMAWIITFGPQDDDDDWEAVVCGPYEHEAAMALAEAVVMDEDIMAVVEPLLPHVSAEDIHGEIAAARLAVDVTDYADEDEDDDEDDEADEEDHDDHEGHDHEPMREPPTPEEIRAGFKRIAARLNTPVT